jgi:hypothetical protein
MDSILDFNANTTVGELLKAASEMNAASVRVTGRAGDDSVLFSVIAVSGEDAWKYVQACEALEVDNKAVHAEVLAAIRAAAENPGNGE